MDRRLSPDEIRTYTEQGFIVIPGLLSSAEADRFVAYEATQDREWRGHLDNHKRDAAWKAIATHPNIAGIAGQILGAPPFIVQTMYLEKHPGEDAKGTAPHQDTHYLPNEPNTLMACWLALSDTDEENGGLCVSPGSHAAGLRSTHKATSMKDHQVWETEHLLRDRQGKEWLERFYSFEIDGLDRSHLQFLAVPKGGGVFFSGMTIHGSYANVSKDRVRRAFATHFVADSTWVLRADVQATVPAL